MSGSTTKTILGVLMIIAVLVGLASPALAKPKGKPNKVNICHRPPGNPNKFKIKRVNVNALRAHLSHGDNEVGPEVCDGVDNDCNGTIDDQVEANADCASQAAIDCTVNTCAPGGICTFTRNDDLCTNEGEVCNAEGCGPVLCPCEGMTIEVGEANVTWGDAFATDTCVLLDDTKVAVLGAAIDLPEGGTADSQLAVETFFPACGETTETSCCFIGHNREAIDRGEVLLFELSEEQRDACIASARKIADDDMFICLEAP